MKPDPAAIDLEQIKAEIRAAADAARTRVPLPRVEPLPRAIAASATAGDGIERDRLDYGLADLIGFEHGGFVDHAFRALLKRQPDEAGAGYQLHLIEHGARKVEVLGNLRWSPEGRRMGVRVPGLLPRYAWAKLERVPILGYFVALAMAAASLPALAREQRSLRAVLHGRITRLSDGLAARERETAQLTAQLRDMATRVQRQDEQAGHLGSRLDALERDGGQPQSDLRAAFAAVRGEVDELRHYVHTANHWLSSLRASLAELEAAADREQAHTDAFEAAYAAQLAGTAPREPDYRDWAATLASFVAPASRIVDLGSGDGAWAAALIGSGLAVTGVEANAALVASAQARGIHVALGDPGELLGRCADDSVAALSIAGGLLADAAGTARLLAQARRALRKGAPLLLRLEPARWSGNTGPIAAPTGVALLAAGGFGHAQVLAGGAGHAVLVRKD